MFSLTAFILDVDITSVGDDGKILIKGTEAGSEGGQVRLSAREKVLNLSQDVVYAGIKTPQHIGLAVYLYHKTRSRNIITVLNKLWLCIGYIDLHRILTAVALDISDDNVFIPSYILPDKFTQLAIDNVDVSECTLDGPSMHVTRMVMFQGSEEQLLKCGIPYNVKDGLAYLSQK